MKRMGRRRVEVEVELTINYSLSFKCHIEMLKALKSLHSRSPHLY